MIQNVTSPFASEFQIIFLFVGAEPKIQSALCILWAVAFMFFWSQDISHIDQYTVMGCLCYMLIQDWVRQHWCGCDYLVIWLLVILQQLHDEYHWATTEPNLGTNAFPNSQTPFSIFTVLPGDLFSNAFNSSTEILTKETNWKANPLWKK